MQIQVFLLFVAIFGIFIAQGAESVFAQGVSLTNLPSIEDDNYKVAPYIKAAEKLQHMGRQAAINELFALAQMIEVEYAISTNRSVEQTVKNAMVFEMSANEERVAILCRMLFIPRQGSIFERPAFLGRPSFLGGDALCEDQFSVRKNYVNWQSEPIEIVNEIPFLVVSVYSYEGIWEPKYARLYVAYCVTLCDWSNFHFTLKSQAEKQEALRKLLASPKWRRPLETWEQQYLAQQIE